MKYVFVNAGLLCAVVAFNAIAQEERIALPADGSTPVIVLDYEGGFRAVRQDPRPYLTVRADGSATVVRSSGKASEVHEFTLPADELQKLLRSIVETQEFLRITAEGIQQEINAERNRCRRVSYIDDASDTVVRIRTADREHEVRFNAVRYYASVHPAVKPLSQLRHIEKTLESWVVVIMAGGKAEVDAAVSEANAHLREPVFELADAKGLEIVSGQKTFSFYHLGDGSEAVASVQHATNVLPQVTTEIRPYPFKPVCAAIR